MSQTLPFVRNATLQTTNDHLLAWSLAVMFAVSFIVIVEPAPVDLLFAVVVLFFFFSRLTITFGVLPLIALLMLYNFGGVLSYMIMPPEPKGMMFVITSAYMAVSAIVIALLTASNPLKYFKYITKGWIFGAVIATVWAMIDYFQLPSPIELQVLEGRATGLFKDPNVYSTYLIFPIVYLLQTLLLGTAKRPLISTAVLGFLLLGVFLSFSRGAWVNLVLASTLVFGLTFLFAGNARMRTWMLVYAVAIMIFAVVGFIILMNIPAIQKMFVARFSLIQSYDGGETGRFGNQLRSLPNLVGLPFGYGPLAFGRVYGMAPHNTFINAFSAYGWIGGISYFTLVISVFLLGFRTLFIRTPWQMPMICAFSALVSTILQGIQIDTEHWRHFYWMLGLSWGMFAATLQYNFLRRVTFNRQMQNYGAHAAA